MRTRILSTTLVIASAWLTTSDQVQAAGEYVAGEALVKYRYGASAAGTRSARQAVGARRVRRFARSGVEHMRFDGKVKDVLARLENDPRVEYAEPNYIRQATVIPDDAEFQKQWALVNTGQSGGMADADIDADQAWDITTGGTVVVGVIDSVHGICRRDCRFGFRGGWDHSSAGSRRWS